MIAVKNKTRFFIVDCLDANDMVITYLSVKIMIKTFPYELWPRTLAHILHDWSTPQSHPSFWPSRMACRMISMTKKHHSGSAHSNHVFIFIMQWKHESILLVIQLYHRDLLMNYIIREWLTSKFWCSLQLGTTHVCEHTHMWYIMHCVWYIFLKCVHGVDEYLDRLIYSLNWMMLNE